MYGYTCGLVSEKANNHRKSGTGCMESVQEMKSITLSSETVGSLGNTKESRLPTHLFIVIESTVWLWWPLDRRSFQNSTKIRFCWILVSRNLAFNSWADLKSNEFSGPRHIMKKTDTCYYMSITKEENSAFVVANHQSGLASEPTQVVVETKSDTTANPGSAQAPGVRVGDGTTAASAPGGNGTATNIRPETNTYRYQYNNSNTTKTCTGNQAVGRGNVNATDPPQVILQVPLSTPTLHQHHNIPASDVHRECSMRLCLWSNWLFVSFFFFHSYFCGIFPRIVKLFYTSCISFLFSRCSFTGPTFHGRFRTIRVAELNTWKFVFRKIVQRFRLGIWTHASRVVIRAFIHWATATPLWFLVCLT